MSIPMIILLVCAVIQIPTVDAGSQPKIGQSYASETAPDISVERALQGSETFTTGDRYYYNRVDLNGDGQPEILVQVSGRWVCGSGGCPLFVLKKDHDKYIVVAEISLTRDPIVVSNNRTNGWSDLILWQRSYAWDPKYRVGHPSYYAVLRFDGHTYPGNPTVPPATRLEKPTTGSAYLVRKKDSESGIPIGANHRPRGEK